VTDLSSLKGHYIGQMTSFLCFSQSVPVIRCPLWLFIGIS